MSLEDKYENMKVADLQKELKALNKKTTGLKKAELIEALKEALAEKEQENAQKQTEEEEIQVGDDEDLDVGEEDVLHYRIN